MTFDRFLPDYGVLPSAYFRKSAITNPIELFWSDDLRSLLRLCGAKEELIGERASDYDRFCALCSALPLLDGHPTRAWILSVLQKFFGLTELPTEKTASTVWKMLCEHLFKNPIAPQTLVSGAWLCDTLEVPKNLPENITLVLNANLFLQTKAKTASCWSAEIAKSVASFSANGCQKIVFEVENGFDFITPSIYHIDRALSLSKRNREERNLLVCQLMRELSVAAQRENLLLVLLCDGDSSALTNLLEYAEESVGLPRICWSVRDARDAKPLLEFTAKAHKNEILAALSYQNVMTKSELFATVETWQVRYPVGRLCFITAQDLRQTPFAQTYIEQMLQKSKTKI